MSGASLAVERDVVAAYSRNRAVDPSACCVPMIDGSRSFDDCLHGDHALSAGAVTSGRRTI